MKRQLVIILILLSSLFFTACGNNGEDTKAYLEILQSGTYTLSADGSYEGLHSIVYECVDGDDFNIRYRNANESHFNFIYYDETLYRILGDVKQFAIAESNTLPENVQASMLDYDYNSAKYVKSKSSELYGSEYNYDIYSLKKKDGSETELHIYTHPDSGLLYALAYPDDSVILTISNLEAGIPPDTLLKIPSDFEEVEYWQMESYTSF